MSKRIEQGRAAVAGVIGLAFALAAAGCAGVDRAPSRSEPPPVVSTTPAEPAAPSAPRIGDRKETAATQPEVRPAPAAESPTPVAARADTQVASSPPQVSAPAPAAGSKEVTAPPAERPAPAAGSKEVTAPPAERPAPPPAEKPAPPAASPAPPVAAKPAPPPEAKPAPPPAAKPAPPPAPNPAPLDLTALEKRLKETSAIGVFTKLTLKNQVDELVGRFRAHYEGRVTTTLPQLRQPYDMLIIKVLSLLQEGDPSLAKAVADSREAIWVILTDPNKFKNL